MPEEADDGVDDRRQREDDRGDEHGRPRKDDRGEDDAQGADGAGDAGQGGQRDAAAVPGRRLAARPQNEDRQQDREQEVGAADAQEGREGVVQLLAALGDQRHVNAPAQTGQGHEKYPDARFLHYRVLWRAAGVSRLMKLHQPAHAGRSPVYQSRPPLQLTYSRRSAATSGARMRPRRRDRSHRQADRDRRRQQLGQAQPRRLPPPAASGAALPRPAPKPFRRSGPGAAENRSPPAPASPASTVGTPAPATAPARRAAPTRSAAAPPPIPASRGSGPGRLAPGTWISTCSPRPDTIATAPPLARPRSRGRPGPCSASPVPPPLCPMAMRSRSIDIPLVLDTAPENRVPTGSARSGRCCPGTARRCAPASSYRRRPSSAARRRGSYSAPRRRCSDHRTTAAVRRDGPGSSTGVAARRRFWRPCRRTGIDPEGAPSRRRAAAVCAARTD